MYLYLVLTSCTTIATINIAFMKEYYFLANMHLFMLVTSIFRHGTNSLIENKVYVLQDRLSLIMDVTIVHFVGLCDFYFALNHMSYQTLYCIIILLTIPYTYYKVLMKKDGGLYKKWREYLIHGIFIHVLGNVATSLMIL